MILDAWGWYTEMTHRDGTGREEKGGFRMGDTCISVADSCWCMAKPIQYFKVKKKKKKSLFQHQSSKASVLQCSAFFTVQLSHLNMTTGKTIALTYTDIFGKVMSLLFNVLSSFVIAFLPRSKHLWISWLQSPSAVILEPKKIKSATVSIFSPSICHKVMGPDDMVLVFWMLSFKLKLLLGTIPKPDWSTNSLPNSKLRS